MSKSKPSLFVFLLLFAFHCITAFSDVPLYIVNWTNQPAHWWDITPVAQRKGLGRNVPQNGLKNVEHIRSLSAYDLSPDEVESIENDYARRYPAALIYRGTSTARYNCHNMAWSQICVPAWMPDPSPYWRDGSYIEEYRGDGLGVFPNGAGEYYKNAPENGARINIVWRRAKDLKEAWHSAKLFRIDPWGQFWMISKWGHGPIVLHRNGRFDNPYTSDSPSAGSQTIYRQVVQ
jgi:hypothetical protein